MRPSNLAHLPAQCKLGVIRKSERHPEGDIRRHVQVGYHAGP